MLTAGGNDQTSTFAGQIANGLGTISLLKTGSGVLTLSNTSSAGGYSGGTTVDGGTLAVAAGSPMARSSALRSSTTAAPWRDQQPGGDHGDPGQSAASRSIPAVRF